jgi:hypothetical protein
MSKIQINDTFWIDCSDQQNFTLKESFVGKDKDGAAKDSERTHGYHGTIRQAVEKYVNVAAHNANATDVSGLLDKLDEIQAVIDTLPMKCKAVHS